MRDHDEPEVVMRRSSFRIDDWVVEPERNRIASAAGEASLEPKVMDVLAVLAVRPGSVISREDIIDRVWGRMHGTDESLTRAISLLRKSMPITSGLLIETVARRGYRLAAKVEELAADTRLLSNSSRPRPKRRKRGLALSLAVGLLVMVLAVAAALVMRSPGGAIDGLRVEIRTARAEGPVQDLSAQIGGALARAPLLQVRDNSPGVPSDYRIEIAAAATGANVPARVTLFESTDGKLLWNGALLFDAGGRPDPAALRALVGQLVMRIYGSAKRTLRARGVENLAPWELVLLATWVPGDEEVFLAPHGPDAFYLQRRALALDPRYAPAHASLASSLAYHALFDPAADTPEALNEAARHVEQARAIAPYNPDVLFEIATYQRLIGNRAAAAATLKQVLALQPDHPLAGIDAAFVEAQCSPHAALAIARLQGSLARTGDDDPVRWVILSHIADLALASGDWGAAARSANESRQIVHQTWSGATLAAALAELGRNQEANEVSRETRLEWPSLDWSGFAHRGAPRWCLGGDATKARVAFASLAEAGRLR